MAKVSKWFPATLIQHNSTIFR